MRHLLTPLAVATLLATATSTATAAGLPSPDGGYAVGTMQTQFVDRTRTLDTGDTESGPRLLPAVVWYPAHAVAARAAVAPTYLDGAALATTLPAIARNFGYAQDDLRALATVRVDVHPGAPPAHSPAGFPLVVFSHGFFLYPSQNTALAMHLASHGYIVVSIAHPGDAADIGLDDGRVVQTRLGVEGDDPRLAKTLQVLAGGADRQQLREALPIYADALPATRIGRSFADWRDDTLAVAQHLRDGRSPEALHDVLAGADLGRLAFVGMSFGGATAATSCRLVAVCRAAVNLDGQNFDPALYDGPVDRPLLLMLSDWTRYGLLAGQSRDTDFSPNDLAYARWRDAARDSDVVRVRLQGARHLGFTDLVALLDGPEREARVGELDGDAALSAIGDLVLTFLDAHVRDGEIAEVDRAIGRHPALVRHVPTRLRSWTTPVRAATPDPP